MVEMMMDEVERMEKESSRKGVWLTMLNKWRTYLGKSRDNAVSPMEIRPLSGS